MKSLFNTTNKNFITIIVSLFAITLLSECKKAPIYEPEDINANRVNETSGSETVNCTPACEKTVDLMAGQHINVGTVHYKNNNGNVEITYTVNAPWKISFVSLYMGNCSEIPKNSTGNPIPGHFPNKQTFETGQTSITLIVPRSSVPTCGCIAAHASVYNEQTGATETAWGEGTRFTYTNWAMYYQYCLIECPTPSCAKSMAYWFVDPTSVWPTNIKIGGYNYTKQEGIYIWYSSDVEGIADSKFCFFQLCAVKLSGNTIHANAPIWQDVAICENYLVGLGRKLQPDDLPTGNTQAFEAAERIRSWIKLNECGITVK